MEGLPIPKSPKRNTHAKSDISMTILMPKRFRKKGMSRMQKASLICEILVRSVALLAAKVSANSGTPLKLVRKGPAKPLVTCRHMPNSAEKMKNSAICRRLNSLKALRPSDSMSDTLPSFFSSLHCGKEKQ